MGNMKNAKTFEPDEILVKARKCIEATAEVLTKFLNRSLKGEKKYSCPFF